MEIHQIENLLIKTSAISKQYEKIAELTGEKFNIFRILGLTTNEVRTHSAFLAELLNTKGSHGCKDTFLKLFICQQKEKQREKPVFLERLKVFESPKSKAIVEHHIGFINEDGTEGGRIDIILKDMVGHTIVIENKIHAEDGYKQLVRYNKAYPVAPIFYLTLYGNSAHPDSAGDLVEGGEYARISYKEDIVNWLEACKEKTASLPIVRETITQYIYLIKRLTNQTPNNKMKEEIIDIITSNGNNLSASIEIAASVYQAKKRLLLKFAKNLENKIRETDSEIQIEVSQNFGDKYEGMFLKLPYIENARILFSFLSNQNDVYLEMVNDNNGAGENKNISNISYYKQKLKEIANGWGKIENTENAWNGDWVCRYFKLQNFFSDSKNWAILADGNDSEIINEVSNDLKQLIEVFRQKSTP